MSRYKVEKIRYNGHGRHIVCQEETGPCPLIAVVNYLILSRDQKIKPVRGYVSKDDLISFVEKTLDIQLMNQFPDNKAEVAKLKARYMSVLPKFAERICVNPRVNSIIGFEKAVEVSLIQDLGIPLFHGWIVNDEDATTAAALGGRSYNDLMDVVLHKSTETTDCASSTSKKEAEQDDKATHFLIKKFMENTKTQLTLHGLSCICDHMIDNQHLLAILFMNGHFHVLHVQDETAHVLQTDLRVRASHPDAVWKILHNVDGGNYLVTCDYKAVNDEEEFEVDSLYAKNCSDHLKRKLDQGKGLIDCDSAKEPSEHERELLEMLEKERLKKEKKARKNAKKKERKRAQHVDGTPGANPIPHELDNGSTQDDDRADTFQQEQNTVPTQDSTAADTFQQEQNTEPTQDSTAADTFQQEQNTEPTQDSTAADTLHQLEESIDAIPCSQKWVAERFQTFLTKFRYYGKCETPYFEGEIEAMKHRNLFEMSIDYKDICHDCEELALFIRDQYDSVFEYLRSSLVEYLVAHGVEQSKAKAAVLKIHSRPISYQSFISFAEENRSILTEVYEIYQKTVAKTTSKLGRRMARQFLRYIIDAHKKGLCWNGEWKASDMKVRSDGTKFVITKVPEHNISKERMAADFKNFFEIVFPYYEHEEINADSGEMDRVLPCYFLQFKVDCTKVPDLKEPEKLEAFQRFLGAHPAVMPPMAVTDFLGHVHMTCEDLLAVHGTSVFLPLQALETRSVDWIEDVKRHTCKPFLDVYWHFSVVDVYELGYSFLLKFIRNFIQHVRLDKKDDHDIICRSLMIAHYLPHIVPDLILFILNSPDMNGLSFSSSWRKFEESDE